MHLVVPLLQVKRFLSQNNMSAKKRAGKAWDCLHKMVAKQR